MKNVLTLCTLFYLLLYGSSAMAQSSCGGDIRRGANSGNGTLSSHFLDPDANGFITASGTGFTDGTSGYVDEMLEFESLLNPSGCADCQQEWKAIPAFIEQSGDLWAGGSSCGTTDITRDRVGGAYSYYCIVDPDGICDNGDELFIFRMRAGASVNGSFSYSLLIDTDGLIGSKDPDGIQCVSKCANAGFEYEVICDPGNGKDIEVRDINGVAGQYGTNPARDNSLPVAAYSNTDYYNQANACRTECGVGYGEGDVYHTFAFALTDIGKSCGDRSLKLAGGTAGSGGGTLSSNTSISDVGGYFEESCPPATADPCDCCTECADNTSPFYCGSTQAAQAACMYACANACVADANGDTTYLAYKNIDNDNDGIPDIYETYLGDHDADGTPDYADADFCSAVLAPAGWDCSGGTLPDPDGDLDGDGIPNYKDVDFPICGGLNANGVCTNMDADGDGNPNHLDLDADNDGIPDLIEAGGIDANGDGLVDDPTDSDGDGLADNYDNDDTDGPGGFRGTTACTPQLSCTQINSTPTLALMDTDDDGVPDYLDLDSDNDGIPDLIEAGGVDSDGDGRVDNTTDADGDGFADVYDPDDDGIFGVDDATDPLLVVAGDTNGDGLANDGVNNTFLDGAGSSQDTDGDGLIDGLDLDADNDGIPDVVEAGGVDNDGDGLHDASGTDIDGDGFADPVDGIVSGGTNGTPLITSTDAGTDGRADTYDGGDNDGDGLPNHIDLDSDNDGIADVVEAGGVDSNGDGIHDDFATDSDGDGLNDIVDADVTSGTNGVALILTATDAGGDGRPDSYSQNATNADGDDYYNFLDIDSDNDGITDVVENQGSNTGASTDLGGGTTLDGRAGNGSITDADGNGWNDANQGLAIEDFDNDGIPNYLDLDADNDGIPDYIEGVCTGCLGGMATSPNNYQSLSTVDANGDGLWDVFDNRGDDNSTGGTNTGLTPYAAPDDTGDTAPDYLDTDSDGDGAPDWSEGFDLNGNGTAFDDIVDYGASSSIAYYNNIDDADADDLPDWLDNQPGTDGYTQGTAPPFLAAGFIDANNNGLVDLFDPFITGGTETPTPSQSGTEDDWRTTATTAPLNNSTPLPIELLSFTVSRQYHKALLDWQTATEVNSAYYEVQRSSNGINFEGIGEVQAAGNSQVLLRYQFADENPLSGTNYYRLKMIDFDGSFKYSSIRSLFFASTEYSLEIFPNPTSGRLNLRLPASLQQQQVHIQVIDMLGREVLRTDWRISGSLTRELQLGELQDGMYLIQVHGQGWSISESIIKRQ